MRDIITSSIVIAACWWALPYVGPLSAENENVILSALLWFLIAGSALKIAVSIITLPFEKRK